jgi:hypothetical protein
MMSEEKISYIHVSKNKCPWCNRNEWYCYSIDFTTIPVLCENSEYTKVKPLIDLTYFEYRNATEEDIVFTIFEREFFDECISCGVVVS